MATRYPIPAVGGLVIRNNKILLIRRATPPRQGQWSIPGGKLDWGESLEAATAREVMEETGIPVSVGQHLITLESIYGPADNPEYHYILVDYICTTLDDREPFAGDGVSDARFVSEAEALELVEWPETRDTIVAAFNAVGRPS